MELCPRTLREVLDGDGGGNKRGGGRSGGGGRTAGTPSLSLDGEGAWRAVRGLLRGLAYLSSQNIFHRDLKPSNLFFSTHGAILLGDFGLSRSGGGGGSDDDDDGSEGNNNNKSAAIVNNDASDATGAVGTALYIAPEILEGWPSYDARVDVWSAGVVAFEIFSGRSGFATAHERVKALRALRERGGPPPAGEWPSAERVAELGGPAAADSARRLVAW
jgi:eukaryotic translation initiation factor 2-alpha kinase 4